MERKELIMLVAKDIFVQALQNKQVGQGAARDDAERLKRLASDYAALVGEIAAAHDGIRVAKPRS
jgi:hypothetical protein